MTPLPTVSEFDAETVDLWARRDNLSETEWARLYQIVFAVLGRYRPAELAALPEDKDFYIQDFFIYKVLALQVRSSRIDHAGVLRVFYRRHLIDHLRDAAKIKQHFVSSSQDSDLESTHDHLNKLDTDLQHTALLDKDAFAELADHGVTIERAARAAQHFLQNNETWVPVYLAFHFCPDKHHSEVLRSLAVRHNISSYHYKACQLGINWAANKSGNQGKAFADTAIGRWVSQDLGIAIEPENQDALLAAFKILCFEALNWREDQEQEQEAAT